MKNPKNSFVFLFSMLIFPINSQALDWSCPDMKSFVDKMYEAADYLNDKPNFDENPRIEKNIDKILTVLKAIAKDEEIDAFSDAVSDMDVVWQKEEWHGDDIGDFRRALDAVNVNLERVYEKYCDN